MTVMDAVKGSGTSALLQKSAIKQAQDSMQSGEDVLYAAAGNMATDPILGNLQANTFDFKNKESGVFIITTNRVFFSSKVLGSGGIRAIDIHGVQSYDDNQSISGCAFRVIGNTEMFVFDCNKKMIPALRGAMQSALSKRQGAHPASSTGISEADELAKFKKLLDDGVLTQDEFDAKKKQLLGI